VPGGATVPLCWDTTNSNEVVIITEGEFKTLAVTAAYRTNLLPYPAIAHPGQNYFRHEWAAELVRRSVRVLLLAYDLSSADGASHAQATRLRPAALAW
jgi:hypothetical protein